MAKRPTKPVEPLPEPWPEPTADQLREVAFLAKEVVRVARRFALVPNKYQDRHNVGEITSIVVAYAKALRLLYHHPVLRAAVRPDGSWTAPPDLATLCFSVRRVWTESGMLDSEEPEALPLPPFVGHLLASPESLVLLEQDAEAVGKLADALEEVNDQRPKVGNIFPHLTDGLGFDDNDLYVLKALAQYPNRLQNIDQVSARSGVSPNPVNKRLKAMEKVGLVERPKGRNGGFVITAEGRKVLDQLKPPVKKVGGS